MADWLVGSGTTGSARPVAARSPGERLIEERTGTDLDAVRRLALASWREATDGTAFAAALRGRGLDLRQGRVGPVILDASGTSHLATRLIGAALRGRTHHGGHREGTAGQSDLGEDERWTRWNWSAV